MRIGTPAFVTWMRARPRPDKVKALLESGSTRTVKVRPRKGVRYWKEVVDALSAYEVMSVELLDEEGNVLRSMTVEAEEETPEGAAERTEKRWPTPPDVPPTAVEVATQQTTKNTMLVEFARLLKEAYVTGASMQAKASEHSFNKLVELTNVAFQRLDTLERSYNRVFKARVNRDLDAAGGEEDVPDAAVSQMIQGLIAQKITQGMSGVSVPEVVNGAHGEGGKGNA